MTSVQTSIDAIVTELNNGDTLKPKVTIAGETWDWPDYRLKLIKQLKELRELEDQLNSSEPVEVISELM